MNIQMESLVEEVKGLLEKKDYMAARSLIAEGMKRDPDAPEPHNLLGILLEMQEEHGQAMKHFRAAWALDPTYLPARMNIGQYADFSLTEHEPIYSAQEEPHHSYHVVFNENGFGEMVKEKRR